MSEKEMFLQAWDREYQTTLKILNAYPTDRLDLKPADRSRSARELLWTFVTELGVIEGAVKGKVDFTNMPSLPKTKQEIISSYQASNRDMTTKVRNLPDSELNATVAMPVAPKQMGNMRKADVLWMVLMDSVHHRGQLSVYLRLAGAKVPSIYGPTADEPWM